MEDKNFEMNSYYASVSSPCFGINILDLYDANTISNMIANPMVYNAELRKLSNVLYSANGLYTQCVDYCTSLPTLDYVVIPKGSKKNRKKNKQLMETVLKNIKHKELVRDAIFKLMIDGVSFYYAEIANSSVNNKKTMSDYEVEQIVEINQVGVNMSIIPLPNEYTKIVGRKNSIYKLAFNLNYFAGLDADTLSRKLRLYPREIRDGYTNWDKSSQSNWLLLDENKTIVAKARSKMEEPWGRPMCLAAIKNILYYFHFTDTKNNTLDEINNRFVYMTLPEGEKKGSCSLNKTQQENLHNNVKSAILKKNSRGATSFVTVASGTAINKIDPDTSIFDEKNESTIQNNIGIDLGFMANLLSGDSSGSYSSQNNNLQLLLSEILMWIEPIASEIVKVINKNVIKDTESMIDLYYLPCSIITRDVFVSQMKDLYVSGSGSLQAWIASTGVSSEAYLELMNQEIEDGFAEKYKPHATSFNSAGESNDSDDEGGRPETKNPTNDNTIKSKKNGSNDIPKPSKG